MNLNAREHRLRSPFEMFHPGRDLQLLCRNKRTRRPIFDLRGRAASETCVGDRESGRESVPR